MTFLYFLAAVAAAYLAGGLFTCIAVMIILWRDADKITIFDLSVLPKVLLLWPAVVGMGIVFGVITIAQRCHFAQESKTATKRTLAGQSKPPEEPVDRSGS